MNMSAHTLPSHLAMAHDRAQASAMQKLNHAVQENNRTMRENIYPVMHELAALIRQGDDNNHDLSTHKFFSNFDLTEINALYKAYRNEMMETRKDGNIQDGQIHDLFPEDLTEVTPHMLQKMEGQLKEWLDNCKNVNNQKTQDLYLMIQIGVALLNAFQNMQKEQTQSNSFKVRNQRH